MKVVNSADGILPYGGLIIPPMPELPDPAIMYDGQKLFTMDQVTKLLMDFMFNSPFVVKDNEELNSLIKDLEEVGYNKTMLARLKEIRGNIFGVPEEIKRTFESSDVEAELAEEEDPPVNTEYLNDR